jgi:hypothetical protein
MEFPMNRRVRLGLGVVGGGVLAAVFVPAPTALADESPTTDSGAVAGAAADAGVSPPVEQTSDALNNLEMDFSNNGTGYTLTPVDDDTVNISHDGGTDGGAGDTGAGDSGTDVHAIEQSWEIGDISNAAIIIDPDGDGVADGMPEGGSLFLHTDFGHGFSNDFVDLANDSGPDSYSDVLTTPFGSFDLPVDDIASVLEAAAGDGDISDIVGDLIG